MEVNIVDNCEENKGLQIEKLSETIEKSLNDDSSETEAEPTEPDETRKNLISPGLDTISIIKSSNPDDNINIASVRSELESEITNLSSTLDSRDNNESEDEQKSEKSEELSFKNKLSEDSVESASSEKSPEASLAFEPEEEIPKTSENVDVEEKTDKIELALPNINGSSLEHSVEIGEQREEHVSSENCEKQLILSTENSCDSLSSSDDLVIDQQSDYANSNKITSQSSDEHIADKVEENIGCNDINSKTSSTEQIDETSQSEEKSCGESIENKNIAKDTETVETNIDTSNQENIVKENNLKRKYSTYKSDEELSLSQQNDESEIHSPVHKIQHLDDSFIDNSSCNNQTESKAILDKTELVSEDQETNNSSSEEEKHSNTDKSIPDTINHIAENNSDVAIDSSTSILRNQLVLKNPFVDPGGKTDLNLNHNTIAEEVKSPKQTSNSSINEESEKNSNKNRLNLELSNCGSDQSHDQSDYANLLGSPDITSKVADETQPVIKIEENSESSLELKENVLNTSSTNTLATSLKENNTGIAIEENNLKITEKTPVHSECKENDMELCTESVSNAPKSVVSNEELIDLTEDPVELSSPNTSNAKNQISKDKILQDWNCKIDAITPIVNRSPTPQESNKQFMPTLLDTKRSDSLSRNNNIEFSMSNKLDSTNFANNTLNNSPLKSSSKYGKQNNSEMSAKSLKRSSKHMHNKHSRQNNSSKKLKEHPNNSHLLNFPSNSIINSSNSSLQNKLIPPVIPPVYEYTQNLSRHTEYKCSKCFNSNFKSIRELENHHKFCLYPINSNETAFHNSQQQALAIPTSNSTNPTSNSRLLQYSNGMNNLIPSVDDHLIKIPEDPNIPSLRNLLNKQQSPLFNITDKPIEITPNLNHYLTQVEQKHKNVLQHHHQMNHGPNLFSHSLDETLKRNILQNDMSKQNLLLPSEQKLSSESFNNRYAGVLNSGIQSRRKLHQLQQQQLPASFLDNENILDYPIIHDSSNIFEMGDSPLSFNSSGLRKSAGAGVIKDLRRFSCSNARYGSNMDLSSNSTVLNKQPQIDNNLHPANIQPKLESLEPIMLKVKQNQFSPVLPPEQLLNKLNTSNNLSLSSASSSSFSNQDMSHPDMNFTAMSENLRDVEISNLSNTTQPQINNMQQLRAKNIEKENNNTTIADGKQQVILSQIKNGEHRRAIASTLIESSSNKKTKKLFLCSSCGSYHENWNLFLHMREMHKRHICLVCLRMFPTAEHLSVHLEMKHDIEQNHFESQEKLIRSSRDSCYLMCCTCEHIFTEHDDFYQHTCANYLKPCTLCGSLGKHTQNCKYNTNEHKRQKRIRKLTINSKSQNQIDETKSNFESIDSHDKHGSTSIQNQEQSQEQLQSNNHSIQSVNETLDNTTTTANNDTQYESNNDSDSDSNNKSNGDMEHFNFNDYNNDLFNLYKSNRLANLAKQKEKENAEANAKIENQNQTIVEESNSNSKTSENQNVESETSEKLAMPKLTLKISKQLLSQVQNLPEDSDEQSSTESTDAEDNEDDNEEDDDSKLETSNEKTSEHTDENKTYIPTAEPNLINAEQINLVDQGIAEKPVGITMDNQCSEENNEDQKQIKANDDEDVLDDSKSDSDMDIDITCNQGGDVAPIGNLHLQSEPQKPILSQSELAENEISTSAAMQVDDTSMQSNPDAMSTIPDITKVKNEVSYTPPPMSSDMDNEAALSSEQIVEGADSKQTDNSIVAEPAEELLPIKKIPTDGIEIADDDVQVLELKLDEPLDKISMVTLLRIMLKMSFPICLYCNHARRIAVNGNSLALHMLSTHRFSATVDSITAEELLPATIISKLKVYLEELNDYYFNMETYCNNERDSCLIQSPTIDEKVFECFSCRFSTKIHKELYLHNRKMHLRTAILCFMCRSNFYSYSEILCHICPGAQQKVVLFDIKFRCCICDLDQIPSAFRLMVHFRKAHYACDVCLENCYDQSRLSSHVWKHKLHHLCYRCGIAYRNKPDITKHLFWKHGTESVMCKRCLQKRWPHVYHFCVPPSSFVCEICNLAFTRAMYLKVHKRLHSGDAPYPCTEDDCDKKFISRKLLLKHVEEHEKLRPDNKLLALPEADNSIKTIKEEEEGEFKKSEEIAKSSEDKSNSEPKKEESKKEEESDKYLTKKKKKKAKRSSETKETLEDLNLQAPNLSESGSSDDSDSEPPTKQNSIVPNVMLSPLSEQDDEEETKTETNATNVDIWNNFKSFQATQSKVEDSGIEDSNLDPPTPILHVAQSDHDYCRMFKVFDEKSSEAEDEKEKGDNKPGATKNDSSRSLLLPISPSKRKQKSAKKAANKSASESSSSDGSSSSSDSSCTCGSNCSCSSSSDSSSDSSSSSDTDSSSSEGKKRIAAKRAAKEERKRNRVQSENSSKANNSDIVDVVTNDVKPEPKVIEPVIYEDDLETDESDTDEDFYDEHPQKLASEILAEKRRQLMKQTCLSPSHNFDIVENSRPSTPSLPEDVYGSINNKEKKVKVKKKKRERKASNKNLIPPFKLNISKGLVQGDIASPLFLPPNAFQTSIVNGQLSNLSSNQTESLTAKQFPENSLIIEQSNMSAKPTAVNPNAGFSLPGSVQPLDNMSNNLNSITTPSTILNPSLRQGLFSGGPAPINPHIIRHSTESSSDASAHLLSASDINLKRSKRARRPNRFYGYSSDDEGAHSTSLLGTSGVFKPIPPPNLTWRKEDLPSPARMNSSKSLKSPSVKNPLIPGNKKMKMHQSKKDKSLSMKPKIPTLKIKPLDVVPHVPPSILDHQPLDSSNSYQPVIQPPPPVVEPINRLPSVPVHHIDAPQFYPSSKESIDSDSESDEDKLTIPLQVFNSEIKQPQPKAPKKSTPKGTKGGHGKANKNKAKNNAGARTSYNTLPSTVIGSSATTLQNIPMEVHEPTPPPPAPKEKRIPPALLPNPDLATLQYFKRNNIRFPIRPPAGARPPREGESVYCYCRCPYDEVSEMIACDGDECVIEWFHFECVGILVAPQGKWYCAECKPNQKIYSSSQSATLQQLQSANNQHIADNQNYGHSSANLGGALHNSMSY